MEELLNRQQRSASEADQGASRRDQGQAKLQDATRNRSSQVVLKLHLLQLPETKLMHKATLSTLTKCGIWIKLLRSALTEATARGAHCEGLCVGCGMLSASTACTTGLQHQGVQLHRPNIYFKLRPPLCLGSNHCWYYYRCHSHRSEDD